MVGAEGFEPPTLCSQSRCATRLRYAPTDAPIVSRNGFAVLDGQVRVTSRWERRGALNPVPQLVR
jgi:hypothetical protein